MIPIAEFDGTVKAINALNRSLTEQLTRIAAEQRKTNKLLEKLNRILSEDFDEEEDNLTS